MARSILYIENNHELYIQMYLSIIQGSQKCFQINTDLIDEKIATWLRNPVNIFSCEIVGCEAKRSKKH